MSHPLLDVLEQRLRARAEAYSGVAGFAIRDLTEGTTIHFRGEEEFPSASTIKIHILIALLRKAERGQLSLGERIAITPELRTPGSGVLSYLEHDVELSLYDIAVLMILVSDNTATNICIDRVGLEEVNALIADLGLEKTRLRRLMQDNAAIVAGRENVSTPLDLVATLSALHDGALSRLVSRQALDILAKPKPSPLRLAIPGELRIAHKTGRMARVRAEAGIIYLPRRPYAIAVMTRYSGGDEAEQDAFVSEIARTAHGCMDLLATTNRYGQGLPARASGRDVGNASGDRSQEKVVST